MEDVSKSQSLQDDNMVSDDSVRNPLPSPSPAHESTGNPLPPPPNPLPSDPSTQSTQISPNKRKRGNTYSSRWDNFQRVKEGGVQMAICLHCNTKLKAPPSNGTSCLENHTKRCKKRKNMDIREQMQIATTKTLEGTLKMSGNHTFDQEKSRRDLANAIILHEYPLSIVDHIGFRKLLSGLQPLFKVVCRNTIKSDILKIYMVEKSKLYALFEKVPSRIAITTDMWSSKAKRGYMAVTLHFIDRSWKLRKAIIGFIYVPSPHTSSVICDALMECLLDWNLDRKVSAITVDNATTNDCMITTLSDRFVISGSLILDGELLHMRCAAHILNLIVQDGLDVIKPAIGKIRDSVSYWSATQGRQEKFEEAVRQLKIPCTKKLDLDCKTRWNSTYLMLETAVCYKDVFSRLKQRERLYMSLPNEEEWKLAKDLCGRLKLFFQVTESFSKTKFPTANSLFPKICEIKLALRAWSNSENIVILEMARRMLEKFDKYWSECSLLAGIAIVLDPRYKMKFVEHVLQKIYGVEAISQVIKVRDACYSLLNEYQEKSIEKNNEASGSGHVSSSDIVMGSGSGEDWELLVNSFHNIVSDVQHVNIKSELDYYLEESVFPSTQDFDILNWWKANGIKYPTLQSIARDILAIPVSTVASESAFSTSGRVVSPHRSRLSHTVIEALMCAQNWLWNDLEGDDGKSNSRTTILDEEMD